MNNPMIECLRDSDAVLYCRFHLNVRLPTKAEPYYTHTNNVELYRDEMRSVRIADTYIMNDEDCEVTVPTVLDNLEAYALSILREVQHVRKMARRKRQMPLKELREKLL